MPGRQAGRFFFSRSFVVEPCGVFGMRIFTWWRSRPPFKRHYIWHFCQLRFFFGPRIYLFLLATKKKKNSWNHHANRFNWIIQSATRNFIKTQAHSQLSNSFSSCCLRSRFSENCTSTPFYVATSSLKSCRCNWIG